MYFWNKFAVAFPHWKTQTHYCYLLKLTLKNLSSITADALARHLPAHMSAIVIFDPFLHHFYLSGKKRKLQDLNFNLSSKVDV